MNLKGKFQKITLVNGRLSLKRKLSASLEQSTLSPSGQLTKTDGFSGRMTRAGQWFAATVEKVNVLYRFLSASDQIRTSLKAMATSAPAKQVRADSSLTADTTVSMSTQPTVNASAKRSMHLFHFARLVAYNRAAAAYIKGILMACMGSLSTAIGVAAGYIKSVRIELKAAAQAAPATIAEGRFNYIATEVKAAPIVALGQPVGIVESFADAHAATVLQAPAVLIQHQSSLAMTGRASMATWVDPYVENGVLILRQAYSATQENDVLVVS